WLDLLLRKASFGEGAEMPEKAKQLFFMVTTNTERFRQFVFESPFLGSFAVDDNTLKKILKDDVALMQFGFEYLKHVIFGAKSDIIRLKKDVLDKTVKKITKKKRKKKKPKF
ncbi:MAG: YkgJ family cysteine cluster protein, partial [Deltaproteobacteria bacterium]|nr:YkgJ family cysteine cluster protein [Deltaproteobacteria bacterium]